MEAKPDYKPISCNFYDELEAIATLKTTCVLQYYQDNGSIGHHQGIIINLYTRNKEEFLVMKDGFELRLDRIIEVNGKKLSGYC